MLLQIAVNGEPMARAGVEAGVVSVFITRLRIDDPDPYTVTPMPEDV